MTLSFQTVVSGISSIAGLFAGDPVKLGTFSFSEFSVPEKMSWGGKQQTVVHSFPGGGRVIDVMGQNDREITFSGIFLGSKASSQADQLNRLRIAGLPVILSWGNSRYNVVISSIDLEYKYSNQGTYSITCIPTQIAPPASTQQTLLGGIISDISKATGIDIVGGLQQAQQVMGTVKDAIGQITPALNVVGQLTGGSPAALGILGQVSSASNVVDQISGANNSLLTAFNAGPSPFSALAPMDAVAKLTGFGSATQLASATANISPFLGRIANNLANPSAS